MKCGHGFGDHSQDGELARCGLGRDTKWRSCYAQKRSRIAKPGNHLKVSSPSNLKRQTHLACFQRHFSTFNKLNQPHNKEQVIKSGRQNSTSSSILMSKSIRNVPSFMKTFAPYFNTLLSSRPQNQPRSFVR